MNNTQNNKELVAAGHEFAKALSSDTAIIDIAKMVSRLAERLDCTTAALREMTKLRDALHEREVKLPRPLCTYADHSYPAYSRRQVISLLESLRIRINGEG